MPLVVAIPATHCVCWIARCSGAPALLPALANAVLPLVHVAASTPIQLVVTRQYYTIALDAAAKGRQ